MPALILFAAIRLFGFQEPPAAPQQTEYLLRVGRTAGDNYDTQAYMTLAGSDADSCEMKAKVTETLTRKFEEQLDWTKVITLRETRESGKLKGMAPPFVALTVGAVSTLYESKAGDPGSPKRLNLPYLPEALDQVGAPSIFRKLGPRSLIISKRSNQRASPMLR